MSRYRFLDAARGEFYHRGITSTDDLVEMVKKEVSKAKTSEEQWHAREQISYLLACKTIPSRCAEETYIAAGLTPQGGLKPRQMRGPTFDLVYGTTKVKEVPFTKKSRAYLNTFAGMVPVRVLEVVEEGSGNYATQGKLTVKVTKTIGAYKKGDILENETASHVVPANMIMRRKYSSIILTAYKWVK